MKIALLISICLLSNDVIRVFRCWFLRAIQSSLQCHARAVEVSLNLSNCTPSVVKLRILGANDKITDRFERNDGNHGYICDPAARVKCGGTWSGIQRNLNYIQGMGFDAIWISPIHKNIEFETLYGDGYAGYYIQDYTQINE